MINTNEEHSKSSSRAPEICHAATPLDYLNSVSKETHQTLTNFNFPDLQNEASGPTHREKTKERGKQIKAGPSTLGDGVLRLGLSPEGT